MNKPALKKPFLCLQRLNMTSWWKDSKHWKVYFNEWCKETCVFQIESSVPKICLQKHQAIVLLGLFFFLFFSKNTTKEWSKAPCYYSVLVFELFYVISWSSCTKRCRPKESWIQRAALHHGFRISLTKGRRYWCAGKVCFHCHQGRR